MIIARISDSLGSVSYSSTAPDGTPVSVSVLPPLTDDFLGFMSNKTAMLENSGNRRDLSEVSAVRYLM